MGNLHAGHLVAGATARQGTGGAGGRQHLRQPPAVRAARGFRPLSAHPGARLRAAAQAPAATSCSRPTRPSSIPSRRRYKVQPPPAWPTSWRASSAPASSPACAPWCCKLFNCVQPRVAVFGKKDYQQLMVIRRMVRQLALPIEIVAGETVRASRRPGAVLAQRLPGCGATCRSACALSRELKGIAAGIRAGRRDLAALEDAAMQSLVARGWQPDYVAIRRRSDRPRHRPATHWSSWPPPNSARHG